MDIASLKTFQAAAATGSFAGAAQRVGASPSTVTERIKQLEHRLGTRLFDRDKRGCRLTSAGRKFLENAGQAVRAMDLARYEVSLPDQFTRSLSIGGQYVLWDERMMAGLSAVRATQPDLALRVTAGASARLSRDLAEGFLDIVCLYDPVFRQDIRSAPLFRDSLILVTGGEVADWQRDFVHIEWGNALGAEISSRLDLVPMTGMVLDLGARSAQWLIRHRMAGYMPRSAVGEMIAQGELHPVDDAPPFDYDAYICWRRGCEGAATDAVIDTLQATYAP